MDHLKNEISVAGRKISFPKEIFAAFNFGEIVVVLLRGDYPQKEKSYSNALAINSSDGTVLWEVEQDAECDFKNPYEGVHDSGAYLIFFKANSLKVYVNKNNGKILRSLSLNKVERPW